MTDEVRLNRLEARMKELEKLVKISDDMWENIHDMDKAMSHICWALNEIKAEKYKKIKKHMKHNWRI